MVGQASSLLSPFHPSMSALIDSDYWKEVRQKQQRALEQKRKKAWNIAGKLYAGKEVGDGNIFLRLMEVPSSRHGDIKIYALLVKKGDLTNRKGYSVFTQHQAAMLLACQNDGVLFPNSATITSTLSCGECVKQEIIVNPKHGKNRDVEDICRLSENRVSIPYKEQEFLPTPEILYGPRYALWGPNIVASHIEGVSIFWARYRGAFDGTYATARHNGVSLYGTTPSASDYRSGIVRCIEFKDGVLPIERIAYAATTPLKWRPCFARLVV